MKTSNTTDTAPAHLITSRQHYTETSHAIGTIDIQIRWEDRKKEEGMARELFSLDVRHHIGTRKGGSRKGVSGTRKPVSNGLELSQQLLRKKIFEFEFSDFVLWKNNEDTDLC